MLDELFFKKTGDRYRANYVLYSFVLTLFGFLTAVVIFPKAISYTFPLIVTLLFIPGFRKLIRGEELEIVKKRRLSRVLHYHSDVVKIAFFVFAGVFLAALLIQLVSVYHPAFFQRGFEYQISTLHEVQNYAYGIMDPLVAGYAFDLSLYKSIGALLGEVLLLLTVGFVFSFFYGGGGILLIIVAASHLATLVLYLLVSRGQFLGYFLLTAVLQLFFIIPLIFSAIGGCILSKAVVHEKINSTNFRIVLLDSLILYGFGIILCVVLVAVWNIIIRAVMFYGA